MWACEELLVSSFPICLTPEGPNTRLCIYDPKSGTQVFEHSDRAFVIVLFMGGSRSKISRRHRRSRSRSRSRSSRSSSHRSRSNRRSRSSSADI